MSGDAKRVLIIKMWALGDLLMATPILTALRARYPGVRVSWLVEAQHAPVLENHPLIDEIIPLDSGRWRRTLKKGNLVGWLRQTIALRRMLKSRRFDVVVNCQPNKSWSKLLCIAPIRVALFESEEMPSARSYAYSIPRLRTPSLHNTRHYLQAVAPLGCPDVEPKLTIGETDDEEIYWRNFQKAEGLEAERSTVLVAPFATAENRCWEPGRWAELVDRLSHGNELQFVLTFSQRDTPAAEEIARLCRTKIVMATGTTIRQFVSLIRHADLVLCVDSSALHIAAATGTTCVSLFGATPVNERVPLVGRSLPVFNIDGLSCAPCDLSTCINQVFRLCMKQITVDAVARVAAAELLKSAKAVSL